MKLTPEDINIFTKTYGVIELRVAEIIKLYPYYDSSSYVSSWDIVGDNIEIGIDYNRQYWDGSSQSFPSVYLTMSDEEILADIERIAEEKRKLEEEATRLKQLEVAEKIKLQEERNKKAEYEKYLELNKKYE